MSDAIQEPQRASGTVEPLVRCPRMVGEPHGDGCAKPQYAISESQLWDAELRTLDRTGLCHRCDAAIYRAGQNLYHASYEGFYLMTANASVRGGAASPYPARGVGRGDRT